MAIDQTKGEVFRTEVHKIADRANLLRLVDLVEEEAKDWLDSNYPDWRNPAAYW